MADYVPANDGAFNNWFKFLNQYVAAKCTGQSPEWTHIPEAARTVLTDAYAAWYTVYSVTLSPHTPVDTEAKNDAKKAAKAVIRPFVNQYLRFPPVTDEDRTALGIPNHDTMPTPVPKPKDIPEVEAQTPKPRVLSFRFRRDTMKRWGKPDDVHGMELVWVISDTPPEETDDLIHSSFATKSPLVLDFKESERGRKVYYAVRWETGTVKKGDFSDILQVFVP
ncbi:MAG: hypothetical protein LBI67_07015 [Treponema sp.]|jgi:hypothetical protein|nr:hypothetical protein [Treponema sp.]